MSTGLSPKKDTMFVNLTGCITKESLQGCCLNLRGIPYLLSLAVDVVVSHPGLGCLQAIA